VRIAISDVCVGCGSRSTDRRRSILSCGRAAYCSGARLHMVMARRDSDVCRALSCWLSSNDVGRLLFVWSSAALGHVWQCLYGCEWCRGGLLAERFSARKVAHSAQCV